MRFVDGYLPYLLARASHLVSGGFHAELHRRGVPVGVWRVLATLADGEPFTVGELAERVLMKQPTLTKLVDRMEADGLVRRREVPGDRRKVRVAITARGRALLEPLLAAARRHEREILAIVAPQEAELLKRTLARLIAVLAPAPSAGEMEEDHAEGDDARGKQADAAEGLAQ